MVKKSSLSSLGVLKKYFLKYKWRLLLGVIFVSVSNLFAVLPPVVVRHVLDQVYDNIDNLRLLGAGTDAGHALRRYVMRLVTVSGLLLRAFAVLRSIFMFFMRQTIIVMSRHIEYDQKNEIYN